MIIKIETSALSRRILFGVVGGASLGSAFLPPDYLGLSLVFILLGFFIVIVVGASSVARNKVPNILGSVVLRPKNFGRLREARTNNKETLAIYLGYLLSFPAIAGLFVRMALAYGA